MTPERFTPSDLVVCTSPDGWSLHAPLSTDEAIATGDAPFILCGHGKRPSAISRRIAMRLWLNGQYGRHYANKPMGG